MAGGISRITDGLKNVFRSNNHKVYLLACHKAKNPTYTYDNEQYFLPDHTLSSSESLDFASQLIKDKDVDIIINQGGIDYDAVTFCHKLSQMTGIKLINCMHNTLLTQIRNYAYQREWYWNKGYKRVLFKLCKSRFFSELLVKYYIIRNRAKYRFIVASSDAIVVLCSGQKEDLKILSGCKDCSKIYVIPNFNSVIYEKKLKENLVLWIGTIDFSVKRIDFMLDVWKKIEGKVPGWTLLILGDGPGLNMAKKYSGDLELKSVSFEGRVDPKPYLEKAKILCVTSSHESFSLVSIEALAAGVYPVINNSYPAAEEIIKDESFGMLVPKFSKKAFSDRLLQAMSCMIDSEKLMKESMRYTKYEVYSLWTEVMALVMKKQ